MAGKCRPLYCVCGCKLPQRVLVAIMCLLGVVVGYGQRANMNITITRLVFMGIRHASPDCGSPNTTICEGIKGGSYNWTQQQQGAILSGFYIGYFLGQLPSGYCADKLGGRYTMLGGVIASSLICVVTPVIIKYTAWYFLFISRIITGITQCVIYPAMSVLLAHWVPPSERATIGAFCFSSNAIGTVIGNALSGAILAITLSWPNVFYFWAIAGAVYCGIFFVFVFNSADQHPHITDEEKEFLHQEMPHAHDRMKVPWKRLLTDKGILALIIGQIGHDFTLYLMMTNIPKYLSDVLRMSLSNITMVCSFPFIGLWLMSIVSGRIVDYGIKKKQWNVKWTRRIATYISFVIPNTCLVLMVYAGCNQVLSSLCYTVAAVFKAQHFVGFKVNQLDISVNFNGIIMAIVNSSGCIGGFVSPLIVSYLAPNNTLRQWSYVMWFIFAMGCIFTTYYLLMAQAKRALWDVPPEDMPEHLRLRELSALLNEEKALRKKEAKEAKKKAKEKSVGESSKE